MKKRHLFWLLLIAPVLYWGSSYIYRGMTNTHYEWDTEGIFLFILIIISEVILATIIGLGQYVYSYQKETATVQKKASRRTPVEKFIWITIGFICLFILRSSLLYDLDSLLESASSKSIILDQLFSIILNLTGLTPLLVAYVITILIVFRRSQNRKTEHAA